MKINFAATPVAAAVLLIVAACAGVQVDVNQADNMGESARVLRTRIDFVDQQSQTIPYSIIEQPGSQRAIHKYASFPDPLEVSFYSVSGRLAGQPDRFFRIRLKRAHASLEAGSQRDFAISLKTIESMIGSRASLHAPDLRDRDFSVQPADTRFARLIVSAGDPFYYPYFENEAGFIESTTGNHFGLLYVDRPCRIVGVIRANDGVYKHELDFDKAGLHWIHIQPAGAGGALVTRRDPTGPVVVSVRATGPKSAAPSTQ